MRKQIVAFITVICLLIAPMRAMAAGSSVLETEKLISQIGTVTRENREAVVRAVAAYNSLSDNEKATVSNFKALEEAQQVLGLEDALCELYIKHNAVQNTYVITAPVFFQSIDRGESCIMPIIYLYEGQEQPEMVVDYISMADKYIDINKITIDIDEKRTTFDKKDFTYLGMMVKPVEYNHTSKYYETVRKKGTKEEITFLKSMVNANKVNLTFWGGTEKFFGNDVIKRSEYQLVSNIRWAIDGVLQAYDILVSVSPEARAKALLEESKR